MDYDYPCLDQHLDFGRPRGPFMYNFLHAMFYLDNFVSNPSV